MVDWSRVVSLQGPPVSPSNESNLRIVTTKKQITNAEWSDFHSTARPCDVMKQTS
jgi:hypothetical protein